MICLHGFTGSPRRMRAHSKLDLVAEEFGAVVHYVRGRHRAWPFWQDEDQAWYQDSLADIQEPIDAASDVQFIPGKGMFSQRASVVLVGFSAGAFMCVRAGVSLRDDPAIELVVGYAGGIEAWNFVGSFKGSLPPALFLANCGDTFGTPENAFALANAWQPFSTQLTEARVVSGERHDWYPEANEVLSERLKQLWP